MPRRPLPLPPQPVRPHRDGVLIALAGLAGGLVLWWLGLYNNPRVGRSHGAWLLLPLAVMCLAALGRRSAQPWALVMAVGALAADLAMGSLLATVIVFTDVVYAAVLYGPARVSRTLLPASVAVTIAATLGLLAIVRTPATLLLGAFCAGITVVPAWTGVVIRDHRNAAAAERLRAEQTALLAEMDRVQAVTAERGRMARELHDVVANHLSAIAIHATAALSLEPPDEAATRDSLGVIRENGVQGLAEMRRLIGLLRRTSDHEAEPAASPTLAGLDALLERARAGAGNPGLSFALRDERGAAGASLPAPVELAAYRIVQESVTNALKHSAPGTVTVELVRARTSGPLTVRVTSPLRAGGPGGEHGGDRGGGYNGDHGTGRGGDHGSGDGAFGHGGGTEPGKGAGTRAPRAPGSGAGLIGMRERVELLGGALRAGPARATSAAEGTSTAEGTSGTAHGATQFWEVRAELPVEEGSPR